MRTTAANEFGLQIFPVVVITTPDIGSRPLVDDRAIPVKKAASDCEQMLLGDREGPDGQALPLSNTDPGEPATERGITDLRSVVQPTGARPHTTDHVALPQACQEVLDELAVGARESEVTTTGDASVRRDQSDGVGKARAPLRLGHERCPSLVSLRRYPRDVLHPAMRGRRARDPRIVLRGSSLRSA